jgi:hypothetical protein
MTPFPSVTAPETDAPVVLDEPAAQPCPACDHDVRDHNANSLRFCRATASQARAENRPCICATSAVASY